MRFPVNALIHNKISNEDGRVTGYKNGMYEVSVPNDPTSWMMGSRAALWPESEVELSTNEALKNERG